MDDFASATAQARRIEQLRQRLRTTHLLHPLMATVTVALPTQAINIFEYHRLVALAEAEVADAQLKVYEWLVSIDFREDFARELAESSTDVRAGRNFNDDEAAQVNALLAAVRKAKETSYQIKQGTRLK